MKVEFRQSFLEDLNDVTDKKIITRVREAIEAVETAATPQDISNLKKIRGGHNYFRVRIGDYRIGVKLVAGKIIFLRFLNRRDIYRYFP